MAGGSLLTLLDDIASVLDDVALMSKMAARKTAQRQSSTPGAQKNRGGWFYSILAALRPFYKGQTAENV